MKIGTHEFEFKPNEEIASFGTQSAIEDETITLKEVDGERVTDFKIGMGHYKLVKLKHYLKSIDGKPVKEEDIKKLPNSEVRELLKHIDELEKKNTI